MLALGFLCAMALCTIPVVYRKPKPVAWMLRYYDPGTRRAVFTTDPREVTPDHDPLYTEWQGLAGSFYQRIDSVASYAKDLDPQEVVIALSYLRTLVDVGKAQGWIIADSSNNRWRTMNPYIGWTDDRSKALKFATRADAELFARDDEDAWRIEPVPLV